MTEQEYLQRLEKLREKIEKNQLNQVDVELEELYHYKPVRLLWFVAKSEYLLKAEQQYQSNWNRVYALTNYSGVQEIFEFNKFFSKQYGVEDDYFRLDYIKRLLGKVEVSSYDGKLVESQEAFANDSGNADRLTDLMQMNYITDNLVVYFMLFYFQKKKGMLSKNNWNSWICDLPNYGYLEEKMEGKSNFILMVDENTYRECDILSYILKELGHTVYMLSEPVLIEDGDEVDLKDTLEISLQYKEQYEDALVMPPIALLREGHAVKDNREYILDYICRELVSDQCAILLCSGSLWTEMSKRPFINRKMERLSVIESDTLENKIHFGWCGSYAAYISDIYRFDITEELKKEPEVAFSIVIPVRNSINTLKDTLQTCRNQIYQGNYEIVISDNSTGGNTEIRNFILECNDKRIQYYKTPRNLPLSGSFEYAVLKTKGKFILTIGSDDGIFPWTLQVLAEVLARHPKEQIIQWERGFYAWPGFNGGQENQLIIPGEYTKGEYKCFNKSWAEYMAELIKFPKNMFRLPTLYINSGFRREYLQELLKQTGRLYGGCNQDIYMGIINISINKRILNIKYPLSMAGMSSGSLGYISSKTADDTLNVQNSDEKMVRREQSIGLHITVGMEQLIPSTTSDIDLLYKCILNAMTLGVFPQDVFYDGIGWKKVFVDIMNAVSLLDENADMIFQWGRYCADQIGKEFREWYDEHIYKVRMAPIYIKEKNPEVKKFVEGKNEAGEKIVDASKYGVSNINAACQLFARLTQL